MRSADRDPRDVGWATVAIFPAFVILAIFATWVAAAAGGWRWATDAAWTRPSIPTSCWKARTAFSEPGSTSDTTTPDAPARAVRPERCTYVAASAGMS